MLAKELRVIGAMNTQFAVQNDVVYLLEVNPRASRTIPFVSKAISSFLITSTMCGRPSRTLLARLQRIPAAASFLAVPSVATISKPRATRICANSTAPFLSLSRTLNSATPLVGNTTEGKQAIRESASIRADAVRHNITYYTTLGAAIATCKALEHIEDGDVNRLQDLHQEVAA